MTRPRALLSLALCLLFSTSAAAAPDRWQSKAREILAATVAMRTAAGHGEVPRMARYLAGEFESAGFGGDDIEVVPHGETASLIVRYASPNLSKAKPVLLLAHMDVVDADPEDWVRDPFELIEDEGFLFGRGVYDNKFGVAMLTTTFMRLKSEGFVPDRDLIIVFTGDEESKQETTAELAARDDLKQAEFALNTDGGRGWLDEDGQPRAYFMQASEKTYADFQVTVRNAGGHSSRPREDNAIYELAAALGRIQAHRFPVRVNDITTAYMDEMGKMRGGEIGAALQALASDPTDQAAADLLWSDPEYVGVTRTTCVATMLDAGHAPNALPQRASATVNCRIFPDVDPEAVRRQLAAIAGPAAEVTLIDNAFLAYSSPLDETVNAAIETALAASARDVTVIPRMGVGYTDGSFFRAAGVPTYGVGAVFIRLEHRRRLGPQHPVSRGATGRRPHRGAGVDPPHLSARRGRGTLLSRHGRHDGPRDVARGVRLRARLPPAGPGRLGQLPQVRGPRQQPAIVAGGHRDRSRRPGRLLRGELGEPAGHRAIIICPRGFGSSDRARST